MYGLPMFQIILCFFALVLHIIAISSSYWSNFYAREFAYTVQSGHFGLWFVCYDEPGFGGGFSRFGGMSGLGREYCDLVDTLYRTPPFLGFASVLAVIAAISILFYFPFAIMRQKYINSPHASKSSMARYSGAFKLAIATMSAVLVVLVLIFISVREQELGVREWVPMANFRGYYITKAWAFYVEAVVALILLVLALLSLMDNNRSKGIPTQFQAPYNISQAEQIGQQTKVQSTTLPRRPRNEYVDSPNLRQPHSSQNSISGHPDDRINADDDIDQIDEDTASPLENDLTRLNPYIRRSNRRTTNTTKSPTAPLSITTNAQPFSYHLPRTSKSPTVNSLNRNLTKSSTDIRSNRSHPNSRLSERRNSSERIDRIKSPIPISTYKSSPSQRAYYDSGPFSPIDNVEFSNNNNINDSLLDSPLLPSKSNQQLATSDNQFLTNGNQPQRFRTRIISTETTTETTSSTTLKRPQESVLSNLNANQSGGTIRYHSIDLDPLDRS